ncbi:MAG: hypothetical protein Q4G33_03990 [bacterium]|nr:hypothetical protein [bacterium]
MKGFKLVNGDVSITNNKIDMVEDVELEVQTMKSVLQTNKGEDIFDKNEGINFRQILGRGVTADMVETQMKSGINQVNPDYIIEDFEYSVDKINRKSTAEFTVRKSDGSASKISNNYS